MKKPIPFFMTVAIFVGAILMACVLNLLDVQKNPLPSGSVIFSKNIWHVVDNKVVGLRFIDDQTSTAYQINENTTFFMAVAGFESMKEVDINTFIKNVGEGDNIQLRVNWELNCSGKKVVRQVLAPIPPLEG